MHSTEYRALVVDDETIVRNLTVRALSGEGFRCVTAENGVAAIARLNSARVDVVVTDLRMPTMHGHALVTELLARESPPVIVVLTGILEPRIAKDLMNRGVDDIMFKPVDYFLFAAKVKSIVDRRVSKANERSAAVSPERALHVIAEVSSLVATGKSTAEACAALGVGETEFRHWQSQYGGRADEDASAFLLQQENQRLKEMLAKAMAGQRA